eukprot:scaffold4817_cov107-Cylindrotheca_fusiformis.AAC.1
MPFPILHSLLLHLSSGSTQNPVLNRFMFNTNILPPDVQDRYQIKMKKGLITAGKMISTLYNDGHLYWFDGKDRLLLADGTIFILSDIDEKGIKKKLNIRCNDSTIAGICSFYMSIERAFLNLGVWLTFIHSGLFTNIQQGFLDVRTFYTPKLRTTVVDERDLIRAADLDPT